MSSKQALQAAQGVRAMPTTWKNRLHSLLAHPATKKRTLIYGQHTKDLVEALLRNPLSDAHKAAEVLSQRYNLGGRRNEGRMWSIQYSDEVQTPSTQDVRVPLLSLKEVDVVECTESTESEVASVLARNGERFTDQAQQLNELLDEAVLAHQIIIHGGTHSAHLQEAFKDRPLTTTTTDLAIDAKAAMEALQAFESKDVSRYASLTSSSNIETLRKSLHETYDEQVHHLHALRFALAATDASLADKRFALQLIDGISAAYTSMVKQECDKLLMHYPTSTQIAEDGEKHLQHALTQLRSFSLALLPIRIDDLGDHVHAILEHSFGRQLELEYAGVDALYKAAREHLHTLAHEQLMKMEDVAKMPVALHRNTLDRSMREHDALNTIDSRSIPRNILNNLTQDGAIPDAIALRMQKALVRSYTSSIASAGLGYVGVMAEYCSAQSASALTLLGVVYGVRHVLTSWTASVKLFESSWRRAYSLVQSDTEAHKQNVVTVGLNKDAELVQNLVGEYKKSEDEKIEELQHEVDVVRREYL
ncbi:hypothetical protein E3P99_01927 [Wallemia hederae]|uniref:Mmc1 C-terminal domain-containing protein n=1 Tax=Wallemia hederae TaxID=1540922 RepID=A0A4T0FPI5_9BASI|nr:hypothetical protein E3P99_01927 [Wallemia hederae]